MRCNSHKWCTSHDEAKYLRYYNDCKFYAGKTQIMRLCPFIMVLGNEIPLGFQDKFVNAEQLNKPLGAYHFPRIGSFEVYYKGNIVFSKLATLKWPHPGVVAEKVKQLDLLCDDFLRQKDKFFEDYARLYPPVEAFSQTLLHKNQQR